MEHNACYELFLNAKDKINSITPDYLSALEELNKIEDKSITMCIEHMKIICLYMLNKQENIVEYFYTHKKEVLGYCEKNEELRKLIGAAFYSCGMKGKAKEFYDIKELYQMYSFEINIKSRSVNDDIIIKPIAKEVIVLTQVKEVDIELIMNSKFKKNEENIVNEDADENRSNNNINEEQSNHSTKIRNDNVVIKDNVSEKSDVISNNKKKNNSNNYDSKSQGGNENKMGIPTVSIPKPRSEREIPLSGSNNRVYIKKSDPELGQIKGRDSNNKSILPEKAEENNIRHAKTTHVSNCANKRLQQLELEDNPHSVREKDKENQSNLNEIKEMDIKHADIEKELLRDSHNELNVNENFKKNEVLVKNKDEDIKKNKVLVENKDDEHLKKDDEHLKKDDEHLKKDDEHLKKDDEHLKKDDEDFKKDDEDLNKDNEHLNKDDEDLNKDNKHLKKDNEDLNKDEKNIKKDNEDLNKDEKNIKKDNEDLKKDEENLNKDDEDHKKDDEDVKKDNEDHKKDNQDHKKDDEDVKKDNEDHKKDDEDHKKDDEDQDNQEENYDDIKIIPNTVPSLCNIDPNIIENKDLSLFDDKIQYKEGSSEIINLENSIINPIIASENDPSNIISQKMIKQIEQEVSTNNKKDNTNDIFILPHQKSKEQEKKDQISNIVNNSNKEKEEKINKTINESNNIIQSNQDPIISSKEQEEEVNKAIEKSNQINTKDSMMEDIIKVNDLDIDSPKEKIDTSILFNNKDEANKNMNTIESKEDKIEIKEQKEKDKSSNHDKAIPQSNNNDQIQSNHETINNDPLRESNVIGDNKSKNSNNVKEEEKFDIIINEDQKQNSYKNDNELQNEEEANQVINSSRKTDINPMISTELENKIKEECKAISVDEIIREDDKKEGDENIKIIPVNTNNEESEKNKDKETVKSIVIKDNDLIEKKNSEEEVINKEPLVEEKATIEDVKNEYLKEDNNVMPSDLNKVEQRKEEIDNNNKDINNDNKENNENIKSIELVKEELKNDNEKVKNDHITNDDIKPIENIELKKEEDNININKFNEEDIKQQGEETIEINQNNNIKLHGEEEENMKLKEEVPNDKKEDISSLNIKEEVKFTQEEHKEDIAYQNENEIGKIPNDSKANEDSDEFDVDNNIPLQETQSIKHKLNEDNIEESKDSELQAEIKSKQDDIPEEVLKDEIKLLSNDIFTRANRIPTQHFQSESHKSSTKEVPIINEDDTQAIIKQIKTDPLINGLDQPKIPTEILSQPQTEPISSIAPSKEIKDNLPLSTPTIKKDIFHANTITNSLYKSKQDSSANSKIKFEPFNYNLENIQRFLPKSKTNITHKIIPKGDNTMKLSKPPSDRFKKNP